MKSDWYIYVVDCFFFDVNIVFKSFDLVVFYLIMVEFDMKCNFGIDMIFILVEKEGSDGWFNNFFVFMLLIWMKRENIFVVEFVFVFVKNRGVINRYIFFLMFKVVFKCWVYEMYFVYWNRDIGC